MNLLRANLGAALGDVTKTNPLCLTQLLSSILYVERVHLERGGINQETRPDKLIMFAMVAENVTNVLAQKAFDAFPKFLDAVDVALLHPPGAVGGIRRTWFESLDPLFDCEIPGDIGDQIFQRRERFHRFDCHRPVEWKIVQSRHAHELGHAIYFRGTGTALTRFAVPAAGEIV